MSFALGLRCLHAIIAIALVGFLVSQLIERQAETQALRSQAEERTAVTRQTKDDIARHEALRDGLKRDNPYVVEFLARERLKWSGPGEYIPPPATANVDKAPPRGNR